MSRIRLFRTVFAILGVAFFVTPLALRAAGVKPRAFENRGLAATPRLADGWHFFDEATRFLIDHMPLRYQAVRANTWIDRHLFATTPVYGLNGLGGVVNDQALPFTGRPAQDKALLTAGVAAGRSTSQQTQPPPTAAQVAIGRHGWLFLQGELDRACSPFMPLQLALARWEELVHVIRASGRRVALLVAPDKATIYPEYLSPNTSNYACGLAGTAAVWRELESRAAARAGIIGLRRPLLAAKRSSPSLLYYKTDSHWNSVGSLVFVRSVLADLSSKVRLKSSEIVVGSPGQFTGDLLGLLGESGHELAPSRSISRAPGAPVVPGPSVVVGDSYADSAMSQLAPFFQRISLFEWAVNSPQQNALAIARSRTVILETVEREFDYRALDVAFINPRFIALLRQALATHPLPR